VPAAVVFDLDGVLVDSEARWDAARRAVVEEQGGRWRPEATRAMMGMSAPEWSRYLHEELGVPLAPGEVSAAVVATMAAGYRRRLPLLPGAVDGVRALAARWPLGVASSANRELVELVLEQAGLTRCFGALVSSEEVARGKPAPDVYLEAARRLDVAPAACVAVEDSSNGLRAAAAAGMVVVAVPNAHFPPEPEALALAAASVPTAGDVTPELVDRVAR
jgi:HAD superfamily hydrolase (TIGR01509 family)